jgi:hypothetical protein
MRYLMLVHGDPGEMRALEEGAVVAEVDEMDRPRVRIPKRRYDGAETATRARRRRGKALVTDGPFPETKEKIAGWPEE